MKKKLCKASYRIRSSLESKKYQVREQLDRCAKLSSKNSCCERISGWNKTGIKTSHNYGRYI